jgi:hypothetical protein
MGEKREEETMNAGWVKRREGRGKKRKYKEEKRKENINTDKTI